MQHVSKKQSVAHICANAMVCCSINYAGKTKKKKHVAVSSYFTTTSVCKHSQCQANKCISIKYLNLTTDVGKLKNKNCYIFKLHNCNFFLTISVPPLKMINFETDGPVWWKLF